MKTKRFLLIVVAVVFAAFVVTKVAYRSYKTFWSEVARATKPVQPAATEETAAAAAAVEPVVPLGSVVNPSEIRVTIVSVLGKWVDLADEPFLPRLARRYGSGESYLLRAARGGMVEEVYHDYCTDYDYEKYECRKRETVIVARTRWVKPNQAFWVLAGSIVVLNAEVICRPADPDSTWFRVTPLEELRDPEWKPKKVEQHFDSVADLRQFTREHGTWIVIGSRLGAPLLGYRYPEALVYTVAHEGKTFYALALAGHPRDKPAEPVEGCAAMPIHVKYRYLPPGVGHDAEYGAGCVSVFGFAAGTDVRDLHNVRMAILSQGEAYWYGDHVPQYNLHAIQ